MENPLVETLEKVKNRLNSIHHVIGVMSGKGGVGKSTIAVNLAVALALEGKKVGLLDIDLHGPDVVRMIGGKDGIPTKLGEEIVPPEVNGVKIISVSQFLNENAAPIVWRGPLKTSAILEFIGDVHWGDLDYLIVDTPPGTGDEHLTLMQNIPKLDGVIMVTTPSVVAQDDVEKAVNFAKMMNKKIIGLVENMSYFVCSECKKKHYVFGEGGAKKLADKFSLKLLEEIPMNGAIRENMDNGRPTAYFGTPEMVKPFVSLGKKVIEIVEK